MTGQQFGKLTVIKRGENNKYGKVRWWCKCSCGNPDLKLIKASSLKNGTCQSCGCLRKGINKRYNKYDLDSYEYGVGRTGSGYEFYFDKEDYDLIKDYCWHKHNDGYLRTRIEVVNGKNKYMLMHVFIMKKYMKDFKEIDHINGKPNDNQKYNLRCINHEDNMKNCKLYSNNTTGVKGVHWNKRQQQWCASIRLNKKPLHLGTFNNFEEAVAIRKQAEINYYGEYNREEKYLLEGTRL